MIDNNSDKQLSRRISEFYDELAVQHWEMLRQQTFNTDPVKGMEFLKRFVEVVFDITPHCCPSRHGRLDFWIAKYTPYATWAEFQGAFNITLGRYREGLPSMDADLPQSDELDRPDANNRFDNEE